MASGNIGASSNNQYIVGNLSWSSSPNTEGNYSDVYAELRMWRNNTGYTTTGTGSWSISIDGNVTSSSPKVTLTYNSNTFILSASARIYHNGDGSKAITISASGGISGTSYTATYCSGTAYLDTIPRASQPSLSVNPITLGTAVTIYTNKLADFRHTVNWYYGTQSGQIASNVVDSVSWTPPTSLASQTPSAMSGNGTIEVITYTTGGTYVGTKTCGMTLNVPSSMIPTMTSITATELVASVNTTVGKFVQGLSNIRLRINGASGVQGSSISNYKINFNGIDYWGNSTIDTGIVGYSGTLTATATIQDSRGQWSSPSTVSVQILPYTPPNISTFTVQRCNSSGVLDELGTYMKVVRVGTATSLVNSTEKNTIQATVQYRDKKVGGAFTVATNCTVATSSSVGTAVNSTPLVVGTGNFPITSAYEFQLLLTDKFTTTIANVVVSTGVVVMSLGKTGVGVGKVWEQGALDVGGDANVSGAVNIVDTNTKLSKGNGNSLRVQTNSGYVDIGAQNTSACHIYTDRPMIYFNKDINGSGSVMFPNVIAKRRSRVHATDGTSLNTEMSLSTGFDYNTAGAGVSGPFLTFGGLGSSANTYLAQIVTDYGGATVFKIRTINNDGGNTTWGDWRSIALHNDFKHIISDQEGDMGAREGSWFLPNGYIIKYGWFSVGANAVRYYNYPVAFPNNTLAAQATSARWVAGGDAYNYTFVESFNKTTIMCGNTGSGVIRVFYWVLGY